MISKFLVLLLLFFLTFSSPAIIQVQNAEVCDEFSSSAKVFGNKQVMCYLLDMIEFDTSIRLVSIDFKMNHDQYCAYYLAKIDSRLKNYLIDIRLNIYNDGNYVPSRVIPTLRLEVPLYHLFSKYLKGYSSNIVIRSAQIQNGDQDAVALRIADINEGRRFIKRVMRTFTRQVFGLRRQNPNNPEYLLYIYILAKSCFDLTEFVQVEFPIDALILDAINRRYPSHHCDDILRDFNASPSLVHEELKLGRTDLARIMLNKPDVANIIATYTDPLSHKNTLHHCASIGAADLIDRCLEMGADPLMIDIRQFRPIHFAVVHGHLEAVQRLFQRDPLITYSSSFILSPLLMALHYGLTDIIEFFFNQPNFTCTNDILMSAEIAQFSLNSGDRRLARILWNSGKLNLSDEMSRRLYLLTL